MRKKQTKKTKRVKRALRNVLLLMSVPTAVMLAGITFIGMASLDCNWQQFLINAILFVLSAEYLFMFCYANGVLDDEDDIFRRTEYYFYDEEDDEDDNIR